MKVLLQIKTRHVPKKNKKKKNIQNIVITDTSITLKHPHYTCCTLPTPCQILLHINSLSNPSISSLCQTIPSTTLAIPTLSLQYPHYPLQNHNYPCNTHYTPVITSGRLMFSRCEVHTQTSEIKGSDL